MTFLVVVLLARIIGYFIIMTDELPRSLLVNIRGYRLHHFVYGNFIIMILSFLNIVLDKKIPPKTNAIIYGIGLGLIIDEFALWSGAITYLSANSLQVFNEINMAAVATVAIIMLVISHRRNKKNSPKK